MLFRRLFGWKRDSSFKPVILVTGCGSGIGLALAELLYGYERYRVVATTRASSLDDLRRRLPEKENFWIRAMDVTSAADRDAVIGEVEELWGGVNVLVNNAGISYRAVIEHMTDAEDVHQFATNYFGPVALIRGVLPYMRERGRGKIINVSSVSGMLAMPTMGSYSASKYALEGLSEALWYEVRPLGVNVSLIQPGFVHSKSFQKVKYSALSSPDHPSEDVYMDYYANMTPFIEKLMNRSLTPPEAVARKILKVIRRPNPPLWIPATPDAVLFYYLRRFLPRSLLLPILFWSLPRSRHWAKAYTHRRM